MLRDVRLRALRSDPSGGRPFESVKNAPSFLPDLLSFYTETIVDTSSTMATLNSASTTPMKVV